MTISEKIEHFMADPFVMAITGMILWFLLLFGAYKTLDPKLSPRKWWSGQSWHIIIGLVFAFAMVSYDDEIVAGYNKDFDGDFVWPKYWYLLGGIWVNVAYQLVLNGLRLSKAIAKKFIPAPPPANI